MNSETNKEYLVERIMAMNSITKHLDIALHHRDAIAEKLQIELHQPPTSTEYMFGTIEIHLTSNCNQDCFYCSYKKRHNQQHLKWEQLNKIKEMKPRLVTFVGGGEPTLYHDGNKDFNDAVALFYDESDHTITLGLLTNGTIIPEGNWQKKLAWLRVSLDAANEKTYQRIKNTNLFGKVVKNIASYVQSDVPLVGVGFIVQKKNAHEIHDFLRLCHALDEKKNKIYVQLSTIKDLPEECTPIDKLAAVADAVEKIGSTDKTFNDFIEYQTNFNKMRRAKEGAYPWNMPIQCKAKACFYPLTFNVITAGGDFYPCCIFAALNRSPMGHVDEPLQTLIEKRERLFKDIKPSECSKICRYDDINCTIEKLYATGTRGQ